MFAIINLISENENKEAPKASTMMHQVKTKVVN